MRLGIADSKATISKFLQRRLETCQNLIKFDKSLPGFARKSKMEMKVLGKNCLFHASRNFEHASWPFKCYSTFIQMYSNLSLTLYLPSSSINPFRFISIFAFIYLSLFLSINHLCFYLSTLFVSTYLTSVFLSTIFISINHLYFNQPSLLLITIFVSIYPYLLLPIYHRLFLSTDPCF